ncbi:DUF2249 domain-containing protein [Halolamina salifodinae]|uniref:Uncharacterized protein (DUF2249 family) n=1 Tax=Halolamina salifodinae TaxID=1202767 RepID=A0A8T4GW08_9EURY|nr:DUF2249 domain-containing protein [Halolamina salifodinae]MBP1986640.1 uncharacterized protein (DUF2249 family) [Halolamina salifodinae]
MPSDDYELHDQFQNAPTGRPQSTVDARDLPPPQPLQNTLERLADLDEETVLVQLNDRRPQHLYPKLEDRGYAYESVDDDAVLTAIWVPEP